MNEPTKRRGKRIIIRRDSASAADDVFAPHDRKLSVGTDESIAATLEKIATSHYLPGIEGGKATWIVVGTRSLAVIAQQWSKPHFFVDPAIRTLDLIDFENDWQIEFRYWCQVKPQSVIASIEQGTPLPDRYGRDEKRLARFLRAACHPFRTGPPHGVGHANPMDVSQEILKEYD